MDPEIVQEEKSTDALLDEVDADICTDPAPPVIPIIDRESILRSEAISIITSSSESVIDAATNSIADIIENSSGDSECKIVVKNLMNSIITNIWDSQNSNNIMDMIRATIDSSGLDQDNIIEYMLQTFGQCLSAEHQDAISTEPVLGME